MPTPDLITSPDAARILRRSTRTVHRLVESGQLPVALRLSTGPNGALLFEREDVENLAEARAADSEAVS